MHFSLSCPLHFITYLGDDSGNIELFYSLLFKNIFIYLFIYLAASGLSCGTGDLFVGACGLLVAARGSVSSCSAHAHQLQHESSLVVACRLSSPVACGIPVP